MECEHCGFACTAKGSDMTRETFMQCCEFAVERGDSFFIGGGEPTLHPLLFDFIGLALSYNFESGLGMVTNGKLTKPALRLADMARRGVLAVDLSRDGYHEPIDDDVVDAFLPESNHRYNREGRDLRGVRSGADNAVYAAGRAKNWNVSMKGCICDDLVIAPNGTIFACGCRTKRFGTIFNPAIPDDYENGSCYGKAAELQRRLDRHEQTC
jgi:sulfatase maturation enzyme AslB (radical SAM superfamily)